MKNSFFSPYSLSLQPAWKWASRGFCDGVQQVAKRELRLWIEWLTLSFPQWYFVIPIQLSDFAIPSDLNRLNSATNIHSGTQRKLPGPISWQSPPEVSNAPKSMVNISWQKLAREGGVPLPRALRLADKQAIGAASTSFSPVIWNLHTGAKKSVNPWQHQVDFV